MNWSGSTPESWTSITSSGASPEFTTVRLRGEDEVPTSWEPKSNELTDREATGATELPSSATWRSFELHASEMTWSMACFEPVLDGENVTWIVHASPAGNGTSVQSLWVENTEASVPVNSRSDTLRSALPVLVIVSVLGSEDCPWS